MDELGTHVEPQRQKIFERFSSSLFALWSNMNNIISLLQPVPVTRLPRASFLSSSMPAYIFPAFFQKMACLIRIRFSCQARGRFCIDPYWKICSYVLVKNSSSLFPKKKRKQTELPWNNFFIKLSYSVPTKSDWLRSTSPKGRAWSWRTLRLLFAICSIMLEVKVVLHPVSCASRQEPVNQIKDLATTRLSRSLL